MPKLSEHVQEWINYAQRDLDSANFLLAMVPIPIEVVCYHCQQSAEKFLKAFLVSLNKPILKTHDLRLLVNECALLNDKFKSLTAECARLTPYGVQPRYPFSIEIEDEDMRVALVDANTVMDFVKDILITKH